MMTLTIPRFLFYRAIKTWGMNREIWEYQLSLAAGIDIHLPRFFSEIKMLRRIPDQIDLSVETLILSGWLPVLFQDHLETRLRYHMTQAFYNAVFCPSDYLENTG